MDNANTTLNELKKSMTLFEAVKLDDPINVKVNVLTFPASLTFDTLRSVSLIIREIRL